MTYDQIAQQERERIEREERAKIEAEVLERERAEFFERWHEHRRAIEAMVRVLGPSAPTCDGCAVEIEEALKIARKLGYGETAPEVHNAEVS